MAVLMAQWPDVLLHLHALVEQECCEASAAKCLKALGRDEKGKPLQSFGLDTEHKVKLELAAAIDFGRPKSCDVCLEIEADDLVVLTTYDKLLEIECAMRQTNWSNVKAVSAEFHERLIPLNAIGREALVTTKMKADMDHAQKVVAAAIKYFQSHFGSIDTPSNGEAIVGEMSHLVNFFKYARIVDPFKARVLLRVHDPRAHDVRARREGHGSDCKAGKRLSCSRE
jgi:hypothetical protein